MKRLPIFLFVVIPFVEIWLLIWVGRHQGAGTVFLSLLASILVGVQVIRHAGSDTLRNAHERIQQGELPGGELLDGAMRMLAGILLILPGYLSDLLGLLLLIPGCRTLARHALLALLPQGLHTVNHSEEIIEGEFVAGQDAQPPRFTALPPPQDDAR
ncbi:MAG: FxsA family protein [Magnetococcales bacterium]|nr:FxsA family protein [Magnetococcales bacterium]